MGLYLNNNGNLLPIAGRGKAEYGASTIRTGTILIPKYEDGDNIGKELTVTFDTPMPDSDYILDINSFSNYNIYTLAVLNKTANGFTLRVRLSFAQSTTITGTANPRNLYYTAFKLYTDTEYNKLLDSTNWKYIACTKTEVGASAVQAALAKTPPTDLKEFYIEFEIASGKLYTFFTPKGGSAELINALNNAQYHCYAYGVIMSNNTLQCTMTSKGTGYSSYPLYVTGMYYR